MTRFYPCLPLLVVLLLGVLAGAQETSSAPKSFGADTQSSAPQAQSAPAPVPNGAAATKSAGDDHDPLLDPPPLPNGPVTLIGGTVKSIDRIRNRMVVEAFGGGAMKVNFDERTHIFRDGVETTQLGIRKGDRVYVDTMLDASQVFARNIRVKSDGAAAGAAGQIMSFDPQTGMLTLRDRLSAEPVTFRVGQNTVVTRGRQPASLADLKPGSLVSVKFSPYRGNSGSAREIAIEALPGSAFTFSGRVTNIDLRNGVISIENQTDKKIYDLNFNLDRVDNRSALTVGSQVAVQAVFQGDGYLAQSVTVQAAGR